MFGFLFSFFLFIKQQQERKRQEEDRPGTGVWIRRNQGDAGRAVTASWPGAPSSIPGERTSPVGADRGQCGGRRLPPDQEQHHSSGTQPGWKHARLPCLGARSPKHGPAGAGQKGGGRKGQHRRALSSIGDPPGTMGVQGARVTRPPPCLSANELLQEGLQLVLVLDAHELVHHVPVLDGQHGGHS